MTTKESFLREINYDGLMPKPKRESKHNDLYERNDIDPELYDDFENPVPLQD